MPEQSPGHTEGHSRATSCCQSSPRGSPDPPPTPSTPRPATGRRHRSVPPGTSSHPAADATHPSSIPNPEQSRVSPSPFHQRPPAAAQTSRCSQAKGGHSSCLQHPASRPAHPSIASGHTSPPIPPPRPQSVPTSSDGSLRSPGSEAPSCSRSRGEAPEGSFAQRGSMVTPGQGGTGRRLQNLCDKHMHRTAYVESESKPAFTNRSAFQATRRLCQVKSREARVSCSR